MGKIIGIDLGTTNSVVAVIENGQPKIIINQEGSNTTPSVVSFTKKGEILAGQLAKRQAVSNPENTIYSSKRFIGRSFSEVEKNIKNFPFTVTEKKDSGTCVFSVNNKEISPEKIASFILLKLKKDAESYLGEEVKEAIITVPAYFNDAQRQATKDAGRVAGLEVKRIINEPTAAALAYGLEKKENRKVAVYDFGGGTFDISILEIADQVVEVKATNGNTRLGGDDFDEAILQWLIDDFKAKEGIDLSKDKMALQRLKEAAEKAKIELSSTQETSINLPFITASESGAKHLNISLTLSKFSQLTEDLVKQSLEPCKIVLDDAGLSPKDIDVVLLVGGSTRIPAIRESVEKFFNQTPSHSVNPDQAVALGAAIQAGVLSDEIKDVLLLDVTPLSLGIETLGGVMTTLIEKNTTIPTKKSEIFSTAEDNQTTVSIHVLQGERKFAKDNKTLGQFDLKDILPAPRGMPKIEVSFDIDGNGIIHVSAKDQKTGKEQNIQINRPNLNEDEISQMVKEASIYEEQDQKRKELISSKNELDQTYYQCEKLLKENKDKLEPKMQDDMNSLLSEAKTLLSQEEVTQDELKSMKEKLLSELQTIGAHIYKKGDTDKASEEKKKWDDNNGSQKEEESSKEEPIDVNYNKKDE